jgi:hypothetical protein
MVVGIHSSLEFKKQPHSPLANEELRTKRRLHPKTLLDLLAPPEYGL